MSRVIDRSLDTRDDEGNSVMQYGDHTGEGKLRQGEYKFKAGDNVRFKHDGAWKAGYIFTFAFRRDDVPYWNVNSLQGSWNIPGLLGNMWIDEHPPTIWRHTDGKPVFIDGGWKIVFPSGGEVCMRRTAKTYLLAAQCGNLTTIVKGFKDIREIKPWIASTPGKPLAKSSERRSDRDDDPVYWVYYTFEECGDGTLNPANHSGSLYPVPVEVVSAGVNSIDPIHHC
jgi:hypothetical protein